MPLIDSFAAKMAQSVPDLKLVIDNAVAEPLSSEQRNVAASLSAAPTKLTLKFFQSIPAGSFIASNKLVARNTPVFAETVASLEARPEQWKRIQECGAAQHTCHVFRTEAEYTRWLAGWN